MNLIQYKNLINSFNIFRFSLKVEREDKESAQKELERLRRELVEKERDSEQRELDRHGLTQQCTKLLQMIEEKVEIKLIIYKKIAHKCGQNIE